MLLDEKIKIEAKAGRKHYVYVAKHGDRVVYVGKGKNSRYIHTINGRSRNYKLNEYFFKAELLGERPLNTEILHFFEFEKDALLYEENKIMELQPECNTQNLNPKKIPKVKTNKKPKKVKTVKAVAKKNKDSNQTSWVTHMSSSVLWDGLQLSNIIVSETCRQILKDNLEIYIPRAKLEGNNIYNITDWDKRAINKSIVSMYEGRKMKAKEVLIVLSDKLFSYIKPKGVTINMKGSNPRFKESETHLIPQDKFAYTKALCMPLQLTPSYLEHRPYLKHLGIPQYLAATIELLVLCGALEEKIILNTFDTNMAVKLTHWLDNGIN
jgi:hypothetical protein